MLPFEEFRLVVTVYVTHANEDPYTFEYLVDYTQARLTGEQKQRYVEAVYSADGNNLNLGSHIVFDPSLEIANSLNYKVNLDSSFNGVNASTLKPEFGKTVFAVLKQLVISLPLRKIVKNEKFYLI